MCGIIACAAPDRVADRLLTGLENLEYRGYDSAGIAVPENEGLRVCKREGAVERLVAAVDDDLPEAAVGVGHTRWSTHGEPCDRNAHPHTDCTGSVAVVHNGIIENYEALRRDLVARGHRFESDTDTEVVPHLVAEALADGADPAAALGRAVERLEGSYALAVVRAGDDAVYAARNGSPLVVGLGSGANFLASDVPAFLEWTDEALYLEDGDLATVTADRVTVTDRSGRPVDRSPEAIEWEPEAAEKGQFEHYMLKEIDEQPRAVRQAIQGRVREDGIDLDAVPAGALADVERVQFVAAGTSYHAAVYATALLAERGVPAQAFLASEYVTTPPPATDGTLVVGVTQSGETADTLGALRAAQSRGLETLAVTNVVGSTAARECDTAVFIRAGPEIGVAATKTFSSQIATLSCLAERLAADRPGSSPGGAAFRDRLRALPDAIADVVASADARAVAGELQSSAAYFFVGRSTARAVALEAALKLKEISYEHAEGFAGGELKHGPLALVTGDTPVFAIDDGRQDGTLVGNVEEVRARDAPVIAVAPGESALAAAADDCLPVPPDLGQLTDVVGNVQLQLVAYHVASLLGRPIDKPRNLAKSVTVE